MIWSHRYAQIALVFVLVVLFIHIAFFPQYLMPWEILLFGIVVMTLFFTALSFFTKKWSETNPRSFVTKLLITGFFIKVVFFLATLLLIQAVDPKSYPYEISSPMDSYIYNLAASDVADNLYSRDLKQTLKKWYDESSDYGYPTYVGVLYHYVGKDTILIRFLSILLSSFTAALIYKLAKNVYQDEGIARFAGILTMLMPPLLWLDTYLVKESIMILLVFLSLYKISAIINSKRLKILDIVIVLVTTFSLFYFRTVLAWLIIFCTVFYFLMNIRSRKVSKPIMFIAFLLLISSLSFMVSEAGSVQELKTLVQQSNTQLENELLNSAMQRGISIQVAVIIPLLIVGSMITPFPSILFFDASQLAMVCHFFNEIIRNCIFFFAFLGILISYKKRFKESSIILLYTLGYIFILVVAGKSFQDRFVLPSLPAMIILISVGFVKGKNYHKYWKAYLLIMGVAVISWNLFKLYIRGML
jgi:hypothetical protein